MEFCKGYGETERFISAMRKLVLTIGLLALALPAISFASVGISGSGGQNSAASISWNDVSDDANVYLFLNGVSIADNAAASANHSDPNSSSPKDFDASYWAPAFESMPYPVGDYQAISIASDFFYNRNAHCGVGISSSSCISAVLGNGLGGRVETSTVYTVSAATSSPSGTVDPVADIYLDVIGFLFQSLIYGSVMGLFLGIISRATKRFL